MHVFDQIMPLTSHLFKKKCEGFTIGLVPTMGALHEGHLALIQNAKEKCDLVVVSIFVNPIQFNQRADFDAYPITIDKDKELLQANGVDVLFIPSEKEVFPELPNIQFDFGMLDKVMEGAFRPGHFSGVAVIVSKLFNIISPQLAFFGQKDFQQLAIIRKLNAELSFNIQIVAVPTKRERDGLAMSSRNLRLSDDERELAPALFEALNMVQRELLSGNTVDYAQAKGKSLIEGQEKWRLEYLEIVDAETLEKVSNVKNHKEIVICIAAYLGEVRLIDNLSLFSR